MTTGLDYWADAIQIMLLSVLLYYFRIFPGGEERKEAAPKALSIPSGRKYTNSGSHGYLLVK